jgi:hypothetical protein
MPFMSIVMLGFLGLTFGIFTAAAIWGKVQTKRADRERRSRIYAPNHLLAVAENPVLSAA